MPPLCILHASRSLRYRACAHVALHATLAEQSASVHLQASLQMNLTLNITSFIIFIIPNVISPVNNYYIFYVNFCKEFIGDRSRYHQHHQPAWTRSRCYRWRNQGHLCRQEWRIQPMPTCRTNAGSMGGITKNQVRRTHPHGRYRFGASIPFGKTEQEFPRYLPEGTNGYSFRHQVR